MDDLNRVLINAGLPVKATTLTESTEKSCDCGSDCKCDGKCGGKCGGIGCCCECGDRTGDTKINECSVSIAITEEMAITLTHETMEEIFFKEYRKDFDAFMEADLDECAGVGVNAEHNTYPYTPDIKKGTLKKTGAQMGFDITDEGIPPRVSKDSINSKK